jgi:hypothetical protein
MSTDRDAQPANPWENQRPDDLDRQRGRAAIRQIRQTLRNCHPPAPRAELPDWMDDELALPAAH